MSESTQFTIMKILIFIAFLAMTAASVMNSLAIREMRDELRRSLSNHTEKV